MTVDQAPFPLPVTPAEGTGPGSVPAGHPRPARLHRAVAAAGVTLVVATIAAQVLAPALLANLSTALLVLAFVVGVPHGAVDHLVGFWTSRTAPDFGSLLLAGARYSGLVATALGAFLVDRGVAVALFVAASALHFGRGEVQFLAEQAGRRPPSLREEWLLTLAHGCAVVLVPLGLRPAEVRAVLAPLAPALASATGTDVLHGAALAAVLLAAGSVVRDLSRGRRADAGGTALVLLLVTVVPPLPAFAVYFGGWHSARHLARLLDLVAEGGAARPWAAAARRLAVAAALPTTVVLAATAVALTLGAVPTVAGLLVVLLVLTFPHLVTVAALDRWAVSGRPVVPSPRSCAP